MEQVWVEPCVDTRATDADGQVALEDDAVGAGVGADLGQLRMQVVLNIAVECDVAVVAAAVGVDGFAVIAGEAAPAGEVGRARFVAQRAEGSCVSITNSRDFHGVPDVFPTPSLTGKRVSTFPFISIFFSFMCF